MAATGEATVLGVYIERPAREVYEFNTNPENWSHWASGMGSGIRHSERGWEADGPEGPVIIRFTERNTLGVLDHYVTVAPNVEIYIPLRVIPNGSGCEVQLTLFRLPGWDDTKFEEDARWVNRDLQKLKDVMESL